MAQHKTYIYNHNGALGQKLAWGVQIELANLISPCISNIYESNWVYFADGSTKAGDHECLVYFMPPGVSVIKHAPRIKFSPSDMDGGGLTSPFDGASEVYVKDSDAKALAKLAFHELLHNKLRMTNKMHNNDGLRNGKTIDSSTPLTSGNIKDMEKGIKSKVPQWNQGCSMLSLGMFDQLSEYYKI